MKKITINIHESIYKHLSDEIRKDMKWYSKDSIIKAIFSNIFPMITIAALVYLTTQK